MLNVTINPSPMENMIPATVYSVEIKKESGRASIKDEQPIIINMINSKLTAFRFIF
ncbi:hypothetical protein XBP1_2770002 [Xenorhabdus bovienii str. puntauvense]|uniref:Uncharacterized protein n=1 Tax=Xenorhabdus bovienii str. puntauvense TaxID=1398201 RepID=A0A077N667_XENBV|nr:hypothetical protein XBP1_2770002 [Xenorhabdus bovienii str. puntauvense]